MGEVLGYQVSEAAAVMARAIAALGVSCDARAPERLARYHAMLADWNTRMNLTGDTAF